MLHRRSLGLLPMLLMLGACVAGGTGQYGTDQYGTGQYGTGQYGALQIPVHPVADTRIPPGPLSASLSTPDGPGPFPTLILLHGCAGIGNGRQLQQWVRRAVGWGYAALVVDSFGPRGVATVCAPADQPKVTAFDRAGDVINAALYLQTLPHIDGGRIGVIGFSHGGATAVTVTQQVFETLHPGLIKASVNYYGACRAADRHGTVPLLSLAGLDDDWGQPATTCQAFGALMRVDQPFELATYPDTVHGFDNALQTTRIFREGHAMQYNAAAARDSFEKARIFLDRWVGHRM